MSKRAIKKRVKPMPDSKTIVDIATLNANYANLKETISNVLGEVRAGNQQNSEIIKTLGGQIKQEEFNAAYRDKCDKEREDIRKEMHAQYSTLDTRTTKNESAISRMNGRTAGISFSIGIAMALLTLWVEAHTR